MSQYYNPRWSSRFCVRGSSLDASGLPVTDEDGNPVLATVSLERVICDRHGNPTFDSAGELVTETVDEMPCSYRTSTGGIKDSGDVFQSDFKMSCPMMKTHLEEGTIIVVTDKTNQFTAVVKKMTTYNWGTNIWIDRYGNEQDGL